MANDTALAGRVAAALAEAALREPLVEPLDVGGRRPRGFVTVDRAAVADDAALPPKG